MISFWVSTDLSAHPSIYLSIFYLSIGLSIYISIHLLTDQPESIDPQSTIQPANRSIDQSVNPSIDQSVCQSVYLHIYLSTYLASYLSILLAIYFLINPSYNVYVCVYIYTHNLKTPEAAFKLNPTPCGRGHNVESSNPSADPNFPMLQFSRVHCKSETLAPSCKYRLFKPWGFIGSCPMPKKSSRCLLDYEESSNPKVEVRKPWARNMKFKMLNPQTQTMTVHPQKKQSQDQAGRARCKPHTFALKT